MIPIREGSRSEQFILTEMFVWAPEFGDVIGRNKVTAAAETAIGQ